MDKRRTAAALIALSVVLAGALAWGVTENIRRRAYRTRLKSMYERSFFELVGGMDDLEVKLGKLNVSDGAKEDVVLLSELYRQADSAGRELSALPGSQQSMEEVIAFVNRLSEFSGMLTRKVADGGQIEAQDEQQLSNLLDRCRELRCAGAQRTGSGGCFSARIVGISGGGTGPLRCVCAAVRAGAFADL